MNKIMIPVGCSNRHAHLTQENIEKLFGIGYELTFFRNIKQSDEFVSGEAVDVLGPKGTLKNVRILGPGGEVPLKEGAIIPARHIHVNPDEAKKIGIQEGQIVSVCTEGIRSISFNNIVVRVDSLFNLELHLDTDEYNAAGLQNGDLAELLIH